MPTYIALLRGVNVAGHKMVAMADLRGLLGDLGFSNPRSVLQSGNLLFDAVGACGEFETRLESEAAARLGLKTDFIVRNAAEWKRVIARNPFEQMAVDDPAHLVVMFLKEAPAGRAVEALRGAIAGRETIKADRKQLYVTYPDGIGRSRLSGTMIEKALGVRGTARNWNTVLRLGAAAAV